ncbi:MAG: hypothetical protein VB112_03590 [Oscillospiraceae bacterium]|nr:hypothetical protein [Oscillospiraceae bacterium]
MNIVPKFVFAIILLLAVPLISGFIYNTFDAKRKAKKEAAIAAFETEGQGLNIYGFPFADGGEISLSSKRGGVEFSHGEDSIKLPAKRIVSASEMNAEEFAAYAESHRVSASVDNAGRVLVMEYRSSESVPKFLALGIDNAETCSALCGSISHFAYGKPIASDEWNKLAL